MAPLRDRPYCFSHDPERAEEAADAIAEITVRLAELEGMPPLPADDPEVFEGRVTELVADHVEPARVKALDELGEGRRAVFVAMAWLEPKLG